MGEYEDCEQVWSTMTETPTDPPGRSHGDSFKSNEKCIKATAQEKCEGKDCFWLVTDDHEDFAMTITKSPTTKVLDF